MGGRGYGPPSLKKPQNIGFPSITGPDPLEIIKPPSQIQCWAIICTSANATEMALRWQADDGPRIVVFGISLQINKLSEAVVVLHAW